jgi:hypothetical protein
MYHLPSLSQAWAQHVWCAEVFPGKDEHVFCFFENQTTYISTGAVDDCMTIDWAIVTGSVSVARHNVESLVL